MSCSRKRELIRIGISAALLIGGLLCSLAPLRLALLLAAYALAGHDVLYSAFRGILRGQVFDENFLMAVATIGALIIGEYAEAVAVMVLYQLGEWFQSYAVGRSRRRIKALLEIRPDEAFVLRAGEYVCVDPAQVRVGETIRVGPGERVPLDAVVLSGVSEMDTSALTGEGAPRNAEPGDSVLAGFVAKNGVVTAKVEKPLAE